MYLQKQVISHQPNVKLEEFRLCCDEDEDLMLRVELVVVPAVLGRAVSLPLELLLLLYDRLR